MIFVNGSDKTLLKRKKKYYNIQRPGIATNRLNRPRGHLDENKFSVKYSFAHYLSKATLVNHVRSVGTMSLTCRGVIFLINFTT